MSATTTTERRAEGAAQDGDVDDEAASDAASASERYRALSQFVETHRPDLVSPDNTELLALVQQANQLPCADQTPTERLLDARLFRSLTRCGNVKARRLSFGDAPKTPLELVLAIREKYKIEQPRIALDGEEWLEEPEGSTVAIDWERLGEDLTQMWHVPSGMKCMKGFMKEVEKKRRAMTVRKRDKPSERVLKPEKHAARDLTSSATETERNVNRIWSVLQEDGSEEGIRLSQLTLDRDSYPQTVVNAFNVMFLIKDHRVSLAVDEEKSLVVKPMKKSGRKKKMEDNRQTFFSMRPRLWEKWRNRTSRQKSDVTANGVETVQNGCLEGGESSEPDGIDTEVLTPGPSQLEKMNPQSDVTNGKLPQCDMTQVETVDCVSEDSEEMNGTASTSRRQRRSNNRSQSGKLARRRLN